MADVPGPTVYTSVDDSQIAYQVSGDGAIDFVYMIGIGTNFERWWDWPPFAEMLSRIASFSRLILFDRRGSGISDPLSSTGVATWESFADDLEAVLDAAGSTEAVILACFDAGPVAITFAATNPDRVRGLILWNSYARGFAAVDYPFGPTPEEADAFADTLRSVWGTQDIGRFLYGEAADPELLRWHERLMRGACTPESYVRQASLMRAADARGALPLLKMPVLVLHEADYIGVDAALGRYVADSVPNSRFVLLPGSGQDLFVRPDADEILDVIEEFATGAPPSSRQDRILAAVLFTDIIGSTVRAAELGDGKWRSVLDEHDRIARSVVDSLGGDLVQTLGDGLLATFDGPGRALQAAIDLRGRLAAREIDIRAGVHFGEIERRSDGNVGGIGVHLAARVMAAAEGSEVMCTRTVKELSLGSGIRFEERGLHRLKGVPDDWELFAVAQ
jgi:pimeloyl-ACP methyl ester carboxylesterase